MRLIRGLHNLHRPPLSGGGIAASALSQTGCVATIGNFDGVHAGHRAIIEQLRQHAKRLNVPSVVVIFEPQPREYFEAGRAPARLSRLRDKLQLLADCGVDLVVCLAFNARLRNLTAQAFIETVLWDGLRLRHLVVGDDFRFGCDRAGDYAALACAGEVLGFGVERTCTVEIAGARVSSTRIRELLAQGNLAAAADLLGRPYALTGRVMHGQKLGRQLGMPTANIRVGKQRPALAGVFVVKVRTCSGGCYPGVANMGVRPTVNGRTPVLEVHLLDFDGDLYGRHLTIEFLARLRPEQRFESIDALRTQIHADALAARQWHALHGITCATAQPSV